MLTAERGVCDDDGRILGAVVLHVAPDFRALPFVPSANPYYDVARRSPSRGRAGIAAVTICRSWSTAGACSRSSRHGRVAAGRFRASIDDRLYRSRDPFWTTLRRRRPARTTCTSATIAPASTRSATRRPPCFSTPSGWRRSRPSPRSLFVLMLIGAAVYAPFARRRRRAAPRPVPRDPHELLPQAVPVLRARRDRAGVAVRAGVRRVHDGEVSRRRRSGSRRASSPSARRVSRAAGGRGQQPPVSARAADRRRDGLDSPAHRPGRQPVRRVRARRDQPARSVRLRTAADAHAGGGLSRRSRSIGCPTFVAEDQLGDVPVSGGGRAGPALGREAVFERAARSRVSAKSSTQIDELNRGVLVGAVVVVLFAAGLGASVAGRVSDPVARLTRATRLIAAGRLDVRLAADTADELGRLVDDFNR